VGCADTSSTCDAKCLARLYMLMTPAGAYIERRRGRWGSVPLPTARPCSEQSHKGDDSRRSIKHYMGWSR
jgi:hypothetical protein